MLFYCALAATLLIGPSDQIETIAAEIETITAKELVIIQPILREVAISLEILDPKEVLLMPGRLEDFAFYLKLLRERYQELDDAPPLCDCLRFPDYSIIDELLSFNCAYRQHLYGRLVLDTIDRWELREAIQEADRLHQIWAIVRDARCDHNQVVLRRQALKKLRQAVGPQAYYSGCLPPHVPIWRFARID